MGKRLPSGGGLARCAAVFLPAELSRDGKVAFWRPDGAPLPGPGPTGPEQPGPEQPDRTGRPAEQDERSQHSGQYGTGPDAAAEFAHAVRVELPVVRRHGSGVRSRDVPALVLPLRDAVGPLIRARHDPGAHPASACWGAAAEHALHLVARGRLLPGLDGRDRDVWRAGPLDAEDVAHLRAVAAAIPAEAHAVPVRGSKPLRLPVPEALVRAFLDAVADTLPRTPAASFAVGAAFAADEPQRLPAARDWAAEVAAGMDEGVRISLRLDLEGRALFDTGDDGSGNDNSGNDVGGSGENDDGGGGTESRAARRTTAAVVQVHSLADPTMVADAAQLWAGAEHFGPRVRVDTLLALRRAARVWPPLARLLERPVPDVLAMDDDELYDLLGPVSARLASAGVEVHWPRGLARELTATAVVRQSPGSSADGFGFFEADELLQFRWQVALGDEALSEAEMDELAEAHRPVVRLRGQWVLVDPALVRKARKRDLGLLDPVDALSVALSGTAEVDGEQVEAVPVGALAEMSSRLTADIRPAPQPQALKATLRDYQLRGLAWLDLMTSLGLGGCLADDMGLGKTVTLIALHLHRDHPAPTLVVCPASLLGNWQREIERFAPGVPVHRFHGSGRSLEGLEDGGFVLTTYATMRSSAPHLSEHKWGLVVADEAQHVKNPHSSTAKALRTLHAPARVALTGTPVENNLSELWALLDWTTPGLLGPLKTFRARHARAVEGGEDEQATERLARLVRPFLLRRKKSDPGIAPELPPKTETDHPVTLGREQAALYEAVVRETLAEIESSEGIARRGLVMKLLTALKQICNHPAQYLKEAAPGITARSGKLELLDELLDTILAESGAVLVFTQYVQMAKLIETHLMRRGVPVQLLHGGTPIEQREEMVDSFQDGQVPVFLLSLKAAGTGLNLTRASHVVHFDRWWNPAVEEQATDRAYRIGQTQPVQVHRLLTEGTVEERIAQLLQSKRALADAVLGGGEAALSELSDRELADLVSLRRPEA